VNSPFSPPRKDAGQRVRVRTMLVDDSLVVRSILAAILSESDSIEVVASVASADNALACLDRVTVDVIVLDLEMPGMNGITALPELIRKSGARVLILSSNCEAGGPAAVRALSLGATDTLAKPDHGSFSGGFGKVFVERIVALSGGARRDRPAGDRVERRPDYKSAPTITHRPSRTPRCILIGSSTGGIAALNRFLKSLDDSVTAPILLTQHLPAAFIPFFAMQLQGITRRSVATAEDGMVLRPAHLYVAPGHAHLTVVRSADGEARIALSKAPARNGCQPSTDPMFASAAEVFGATAIAIVLSGMGHDGAEGARLIRARGGAVVAQSQDSCVVWGMPGSIVNAGLASAVLDPADASEYVNRAARRSAA